MRSRPASCAPLARLDDRDRTVIALRYFAGLSEAETAAALDVPAGTVKSRLRPSTASATSSRTS